MGVRQILIFIALAAAVGLGYTNCNNAKFSSVGTQAAQQVCNPFGGQSSTPGQGLVAQGVYYINPADVTAARKANADPINYVNNSVENFFDVANNSKLGIVNANLFLNNIGFPNMYFTKGFVDSKGSALKAADGTQLDEYFAFRAKSTFVLGSWPAGDYQIATMTDDGSILTMTGGNADGSDLKIMNDGNHSLRMMCAHTTLHISANSQIPLTFDYFQGPRVTIGLMMMYRPVAMAGTTVDPLCGQGGQSDTYFFNDHDNNNNAVVPSVPQAPYMQASGGFVPSNGTGGWKVVEAEHFTLSSTVTNTGCN